MSAEATSIEDLKAALSSADQTPNDLLALLRTLDAEHRGGPKIVSREISYEDRANTRCKSGWETRRCLTLTYDNGETATNCGGWSCQ